MGWNPLKEAEKKAKEAVKKVIEPATRAAESAIWKLRRETWAKIEKKGKDVLGDIDDHAESAFKTAEHKLHDAVDEIEKTVEERIPDMLEQALEELSRAVAKEGFEKARDSVRAANKELNKLRQNKPKLVDSIDELGFTLKLGPVGLSYGGFYSRSNELLVVLDNLASKPPSFRRTPVIKAIEALGPDHIDLGIDIQLAALVVSSDALEVGFSLDSMPLKLFTEIGDIILEEIGVPE